MTHRAPFIVALWLLLCPALAAADTLRLVMVEQMGCIYCQQWNREIAPEYPKTSEGKAAPLQRVDIGDLPEDLSLNSRPVLTPTFILVRDGQELSRLEGYPGEDFFWPLLGRMIEEAGASPADVEETGS